MSSFCPNIFKNSTEGQYVCASALDFKSFKINRNRAHVRFLFCPNTFLKSIKVLSRQLHVWFSLLWPLQGFQSLRVYTMSVRTFVSWLKNVSRRVHAQSCFFLLKFARNDEMSVLSLPAASQISQILDRHISYLLAYTWDIGKLPNSSDDQSCLSLPLPPCSKDFYDDTMIKAVPFCLEYHDLPKCMPSLLSQLLKYLKS